MYYNNSFSVARAFIFAALFLLPLMSIDLISQSNPAIWNFPEGNLQATKYQSQRSELQDIKKFEIKLRSNAIKGDLQPLIDDIVDNDKILASFRFKPLEIAAVIGGKLVVIDGAGRHYPALDVSGSDFLIKGLPYIIDNRGAALGLPRKILAFESIEYEKNDKNKIYTALAAYNETDNKFELIRKLAVDMADFGDLDFGSIRPFYSRVNPGSFYLYATLNMTIPEDNSDDKDFVRAVIAFDLTNTANDFPLPVVGNITDRILVGPHIGYYQPSVMEFPNRAVTFFPVTPVQDSSYTINSKGQTTASNGSYILGVSLTNQIGFELNAISMNQGLNKNYSQIRPYFLEISEQTSAPNPDNLFLAVAEEYLGADSSNGIPQLHFYDYDHGQGISKISVNDTTGNSISGSKDHYWSVAVGDVDGAPVNSYPEYFPNNNGNELLFTNSTREFAVSQSRLFVMRYRTDSPEKDPANPGEFKKPFDTIATHRIDGWLAAVNDLDGVDSARKDEIILANGSELLVLGMNDYRSKEFLSGHAFDTVFVHRFNNETISSVAIADIDGDERNDIIVTTYDSLYVIGIPLEDVIEVTSPIVQDTPYEIFCPYDTLNIEWNNVIQGNIEVDIWYKPIFNTQNNFNPLLINERIMNVQENVVYPLIIPEYLQGMQGYFVVVPTGKGFNETLINKTKIIEINNITIDIEPLQTNQYSSGDVLDINVLVECADTVKMFFEIDSIWQEVDEIIVSRDGSTLSAVIPCFDFPCGQVPGTSVQMPVKLETLGNYSVTTIIDVVPAEFPLLPVIQATASPNVFIEWDATNSLFNDFACNNFKILISTDNGLTFTDHDSTDIADGNYEFITSTDLPDSIILRLCCQNNCIRKDTVIALDLDNLNIIVPNPYDPGAGEVEFIYTVPGDLNVTIKIFDQNNFVVAVPVNNQFREKGIIYTDNWDGRKSSGELVSNGVYYLVLELSNGEREIYPIYIKK